MPPRVSDATQEQVISGSCRQRYSPQDHAPFLGRREDPHRARRPFRHSTASPSASVSRSSASVSRSSSINNPPDSLSDPLRIGDFPVCALETVVLQDQHQQHKHEPMVPKAKSHRR